MDYGKSFWEIQRDRRLEIEVWQRELNKALQVSPSSMSMPVTDLCCACALRVSCQGTSGDLCTGSTPFKYDLLASNLQA